MACLNWSYQGNNGPDHWHKLYSTLLWITWKPSTCKEILNAGYSFQVNFEDKDNQLVLNGRPLTGTYRLWQFHFHWGQNDEQGLEHTVDGRKYASDRLHLIHWNMDKYLNVTEAFDKLDGLAIVSVFLKVNFGPGHPNIINMCESFPLVSTDTPFSDFDPKSMDYWTYNGSLIYPALHRSVIWIIVEDPIYLAQFCAILSSAEEEAPCPVLSNHQQPLPLKGRVVRGEFQTTQANLELSLLIKSNTSKQRLQKNVPKK
uniref:carbonic anhydrase n=1 Tax=Accipiter nisus TaxID=211598 RepID=A0A8B9M672_9AVES